MKMTGKFFEYMGPYGQTYRCPKCGYEYRYYINTEVLDEFK